jgi:hypothetical protein
MKKVELRSFCSVKDGYGLSLNQYIDFQLGSLVVQVRMTCVKRSGL